MYLEQDTIYMGIAHVVGNKTMILLGKMCVFGSEWVVNVYHSVWAGVNGASFYTSKI